MPDAKKGFGEWGHAATASGARDMKTKEVIVLALGVVARCDACSGFYRQTLVKLGTTRQKVDEPLGVPTYMSGGPSLMSAASAIHAFEAFSRPPHHA